MTETESARFTDLHEQLDRVEQCARQEHGHVRAALLLSLVAVVRALVREVTALKAQKP
jgi:hypothetical protein